MDGLSQMPGSFITHAYHQANMVADYWIAKFALCNFLCSWGSLPPIATDILLKDLSLSA